MQQAVQQQREMSDFLPDSHEYLITEWDDKGEAIAVIPMFVREEAARNKFDLHVVNAQRYVKRITLHVLQHNNFALLMLQEW